MVSIGMNAYATIEYPFGGIKAQVLARDFWKQLEGGSWEWCCIKHVSSLLLEGQTILDVGAWIGPYTLLFSSLVGTTGRVYAFEPDPNAFRTLSCNVSKNASTNVRVEPLCLTDFVGKAKLRSGRFGQSLSSLMTIGNGETQREIVVNTTTIDTYCDENGIQPDGMKIDVEGAEGLVLRGCRNVIKTYAPWVLLEFHGNLMSEAERITNWRRVTMGAKKITFIDGDTTRYRCGSEVDSMPDCTYFHVFMRY
jgi:FkbM family methyltransferase